MRSRRSVFFMAKATCKVVSAATESIRALLKCEVVQSMSICNCSVSIYVICGTGFKKANIVYLV